ncbi:uncharacterized protein LACBIDRAFT_300186 [Laccaria bicolor S238N-H82]|uniref:Predicted protein n=1 Tax=Laccaria bicolor (strain S238N-H82 / ATCC MYA-4686) TaxID=486041 RepID=B0DG86_LACBS|nr:uncharacterized protein LACBIDRAFT_300186 [Laccaria bicolor S238N-H82]EDR06468.1 predicted protein [Laccaria bicolor S238N-H82]|eukprot:XP_001882840.1 predicted protein [Laccaria bicolor S238N-H82]
MISHPASQRLALNFRDSIWLLARSARSRSSTNKLNSGISLGLALAWRFRWHFHWILEIFAQALKL